MGRYETAAPGCLHEYIRVTCELQAHVLLILHQTGCVRHSYDLLNLDKTKSTVWEECRDDLTLSGTALSYRVNSSSLTDSYCRVTWLVKRHLQKSSVASSIVVVAAVAKKYLEVRSHGTGFTNLPGVIWLLTGCVYGSCPKAVTSCPAGSASSSEQLFLC